MTKERAFTHKLYDDIFDDLTEFWMWHKSFWVLWLSVSGFRSDSCQIKVNCQTYNWQLSVDRWHINWHLAHIEWHKGTTTNIKATTVKRKVVEAVNQSLASALNQEKTTVAFVCVNNIFLLHDSNPEITLLNNRNIRTNNNYSEISELFGSVFSHVRVNPFSFIYL